MHGRFATEKIHFDGPGQALADLLEMINIHVVFGAPGIVTVVTIHIAAHG
jgi:hypothetical protein